MENLDHVLPGKPGDRTFNGSPEDLIDGVR
jgi:hypothetical protein